MRTIFAIFCLICMPLGWMKGDSLTLGSTNDVAGAVLQFPFSLTNTNQIVAMQFDLKFPAGVVDVGDASAASASTDHTAQSREVSAGTRRILVYSGSNQLLPNDLQLSVAVTLKPGTPQGGPTLNVSSIILTNAQGQTFSPTINRPALDAWRLANFTETERNDPGIIGDDKDPDGDGLSNLLEFLMGGNPRLQQATFKPQTAHGIDPSDNHHYITLTFRAGKSVTAGTLTVQGSDNLIDWNTSGIQLTPTGVEDATSMEYEAALQVDGATRQFLRIVGARNAGQ